MCPDIRRPQSGEAVASDRVIRRLIHNMCGVAAIPAAEVREAVSQAICGGLARRRIVANGALLGLTRDAGRACGVAPWGMAHSQALAGENPVRYNTQSLAAAG
jgi:hypothetical protein